jgi:hypothetical protein
MKFGNGLIVHLVKRSMKLVANLKSVKMQDELLTPKDVRNILKCSPAYVYKLVERGHLPAWRGPDMGKGKEKPRSMIRFMRADVVKLIENYYTST